VVWSPVFTQRALHAAALPCSVWISQPMRGQLVGQLEGGSQVSFSSSLPLPHTGPPPSPGWSSGASRAPASSSPDDTPASTMSMTWPGVRLVLQPADWQQTPIGTDACMIRSHVNPGGHCGFAGSHSTRAFGMLGVSVQVAASARAGSATAKRTTRVRRTG
jgi:hypothetical protein